MLYMDNTNSIIHANVSMFYSQQRKKKGRGEGGGGNIPFKFDIIRCSKLYPHCVCSLIKIDYEIYLLSFQISRF